MNFYWGEAYPRNDVSGLNIFLYLLDDDVALLLIKNQIPGQTLMHGGLLILGNRICTRLWKLPG